MERSQFASKSHLFGAQIGLEGALEKAMMQYNENLESQKHEQELLLEVCKNDFKREISKLKEENEDVLKTTKEQYESIIISNKNYLKGIFQKDKIEMERKIEELEETILKMESCKTSEVIVSQESQREELELEYQEKLEKDKKKLKTEYEEKLHIQKIELESKYTKHDEKKDQELTKIIKSYEEKITLQKELHDQKTSQLNTLFTSEKELLIEREKILHLQELEELKTRLETEFTNKLKEERKRFRTKMNLSQEKCRNVLSINQRDVIDLISRFESSLHQDYQQEFLDWMKKREEEKKIKASKIKNEIMEISKKNLMELSSVFDEEGDL